MFNENQKALHELRQELSSKVEEKRGIVEKAEKENRNLSDEEKTKFDNIDKDVKQLREREERLHSIVMEEMENREKYVEEKENRMSEDEKHDLAQRKSKAFRNFLLYGSSGLNEEERGLLKPYNSEERAQSTTGSAGGYTIPEGFSNELEVAMKSFGGIFQAGRVQPTATGNDIPWPTINDTANVGAILGENTSFGSSTDASFGVVTLKAFKYSSKPVLISNELLQDSAFNLEQYIAQMLVDRIYRAFNAHATATGDGTAQPKALIADTIEGVEAAAGAISYDDLIDLQHSVDISYRGQASWMMHDSTLKTLRKLKDSTGLPIYQENLRVGEPATLLGKPIIINNDMEEVGASKKTITFGNHNKYLIRQVSSIGVKRLNERYADLDQVAFVMFQRLDGRLIDAGTNPVKHLAHAAS